MSSPSDLIVFVNRPSLTLLDVDVAEELGVDSQPEPIQASLHSHSGPQSNSVYEAGTSVNGQRGEVEPRYSVSGRELEEGEIDEEAEARLEGGSSTRSYQVYSRYQSSAVPHPPYIAQLPHRPLSTFAYQAQPPPHGNGARRKRGAPPTVQANPARQFSSYPNNIATYSQSYPVQPPPPVFPPWPPNHPYYEPPRGYPPHLPYPPSFPPSYNPTSYAWQPPPRPAQPYLSVKPHPEPFLVPLADGSTAVWRPPITSAPYQAAPTSITPSCDHTSQVDLDLANPQPSSRTAYPTRPIPIVQPQDKPAVREGTLVDLELDLDDYSTGKPLDPSYSLEAVSSPSTPSPPAPSTPTYGFDASQELYTPNASAEASFELNPNSAEFHPFATSLVTDQPVLFSTPDHVKSLFTFHYQAAEPFPEAQVIAAPVARPAKGLAQKKKKKIGENISAFPDLLRDSSRESTSVESIIPEEAIEARIRQAQQRLQTLVDVVDEAKVDEMVAEAAEWPPLSAHGKTGSSATKSEPKTTSKLIDDGGNPLPLVEDTGKYAWQSIRKPMPEDPAAPADLCGAINGLALRSPQNDTSTFNVLSTPPVPPVQPFASTKRKAPSTASAYATLLSQPSPRDTIPPALLASSETLQNTILRSWIEARPDAAKQTAIRLLLEKLTYNINKYLGGGPSLTKGERRFEVDVFGSVSWGGETGKGYDLDLVILDRDQPQGYHPDCWRTPPDSDNTGGSAKSTFRRFVAIPTQPAAHDLNKLADLLRAMGMKQLQPVYTASTPIVKFVSVDAKGLELECDLNFNDLGGWYNSALILRYCQISPYVLRPMIHALKLWLKAQGLNDPSGASGPASMSSYCLVLMAIAYLQIRGQLPNLQADINVPIPSYPSDVDDPDLVWVCWGKQQGTPCHVAFATHPPEGWKPANPDFTVADALRGFFSYFDIAPPESASTPKFDRQNGMISILNGGLLKRVHPLGQYVPGSKEERMAREPFMGTGSMGIQPMNWKERRLVVQDPFIWQKNCTQAMSSAGMNRWQEAITRTNARLRLKGTSSSLDDLLAGGPGPVSTPSRVGMNVARRGGSRGNSPAFGFRFPGPPSRDSSPSNGVRRLWSPSQLAGPGRSGAAT